MFYITVKMEMLLQLHIKMLVIRLMIHIRVIRHIKLIIIIISTKTGKVNKLSI